MNYTGLSQNRPGYAIPITFIGLFLIIPIFTAIYEKFNSYKQYLVSTGQYYDIGLKNFFNTKLIIQFLLTAVLIIFITIICISLQIALKCDMQYQIGSRLIASCGGTSYYQKESGDELVSSYLLDENPISHFKSVNVLINIVFLFSILSGYIILIGYNIYESRNSAFSIGKIWLRRFCAAFIGAYTVIYLVFSSTELMAITHLNYATKAKNDFFNNKNAKTYFVSKLLPITVFIIGTVVFDRAKFLNTKTIMLIIGYLSLLILLSVVAFYYNGYWQGLYSNWQDYIQKCSELNKYITDNIYTKSNTLISLTTAQTDLIINKDSNPTVQSGIALQNLLYNSILDLEPNVTDTLENTINNRKAILYQYIKHNNGKELAQLSGNLDSNELAKIRTSMASLRSFNEIKNGFGKFTRIIVGIFMAVTCIGFYILFNKYYKDNPTQFTTISIFAIIILLLITCIFGWISNII